MLDVVVNKEEGEKVVQHSLLSDIENIFSQYSTEKILTRIGSQVRERLERG